MWRWRIGAGTAALRPKKGRADGFAVRSSMSGRLAGQGQRRRACHAIGVHLFHGVRRGLLLRGHKRRYDNTLPDFCKVLHVVTFLWSLTPWRGGASVGPSATPDTNPRFELEGPLREDAMRIERPTRLRLLDVLKQGGPRPVRELRVSLGVSAMAVRQHLTGLERDGLVQ